MPRSHLCYWECRNCGYVFKHRFRKTSDGRCPRCDGVIHNVDSWYYKQMMDISPVRDQSCIKVNQGEYIDLSVDRVFKQSDKQLEKIDFCPCCGQPVGGEQVAD